MADVATLNASLGLNSAKFESGMKNADRTMRNTTKRMNNSLASFDKKAQQSFQRAAQSAAAFEGPLGGVAGRLSTLSSITGSVGVAMGATALAVTGVGLAFGKAASVSRDFERSQFRLAAVLRATGNASGQTTEGIREFSRQLARETLAGRIEVEEAAGILLTFRSVAGTTFTRTLTLAQDLAAAGFGNLKTNTLQLGKALQDPVRGLTALSRSGVTFTDAQKDMIKSMVEAGDAAQAQTLILDELQKQVGGTGSGEGQGLDGSFDSLSQSIQETFLALDRLVGAKDKANGFIQLLDKGLQRWNAALEPNIPARLIEETEKLYRMQEQLAESHGPFAKTDTPAYRAHLAAIEQQKKLIVDLNKAIEEPVKKQAKADNDAKAAKEAAEQERKAAQIRKEADKQRKTAAKELDQYNAKIESVAAAMEFEASKRGKTNQQIAVMNALNRAGIDLQDVIITQSGALVGSYDEQVERIAELARHQQNYKENTEILKKSQEEEQKVKDKAIQITENLRSAQEKYQGKLNELQGLYDSGLISAETFARGQKEALVELRNETDLYTDSMIDMFNNFAQLAIAGELSWRSFGKVAINTLFEVGKTALESEGTISGAFDSIATSLGGVFDFIGGLFGGGGGAAAGAGAAVSGGSLFGGFFADGGRPPVGIPSMVGERGPELFVPDRAGTIISNENLGTMGGPTFNVDMRGASVETVQRLEQFVSEMNGSLEQRAVSATADAMARGQI